MRSYFESFGLVAVKAMTAGALATDLLIRGLKDAVKEETGYLTRPSDDGARECAFRFLDRSTPRTIYSEIRDRNVAEHAEAVLLLGHLPHFDSSRPEKMATAPLHP